MSIIPLALPGLVIGVFLLATRQPSLIKEMQIGWGILILLAVAAYLFRRCRDARPLESTQAGSGRPSSRW